jgi:hypothetical protein
MSEILTQQESPKTEEKPIQQETEKPTQKTPKIWLDEIKPISVDCYVYHDEERNIQLISKEEISAENQKTLNLGLYTINAKFDIPSRKKLQKYREIASKWNDEAGMILIDRNLVRNQLMRHHLKEISIPDSKDQTLILERDKKNSLTSKSEETLENLHPTIMEYLLDKFIITADLVF